MEVKTLACDWCQMVRPAIARPTLVLGAAPNKNDPQVDLCKGHLGELIRAFRPLARTSHQRGLGRRRLGKMRHVAARVEQKRKKALEQHYREQAARPRVAKEGPKARQKERQRELARAAQAKPKKTRVMSAETRRALNEKVERHWQLQRQAVLAVMPNGGQRLSRPEIQKLAQLTHAQTYAVLCQLVARKGIVAHGPVGRYRTYALPVA